MFIVVASLMVVAKMTVVLSRLIMSMREAHGNAGIAWGRAGDSRYCSIASAVRGAKGKLDARGRS